MSVIAVLGLKGGIGKTTIAAHLAVELATRGARVLAIDCDPQESLLAWSRTQPGGKLARLVYPVPESLDKGFLLRLHSHEAGYIGVAGYLAAWSVRPKSQTRARVVHVILDTPPGSQEAALRAALEADMVLLPAGPSPLDLLALEQTLAVARQAQEERGHRGRFDTIEAHGVLPRIGLVPNRAQTATTLGKDLPSALRAYGERVLPVLRQHVAYVEAARLGHTVGEHQPGAPAHEDISALTCAVEKLLP